MPLNWLLNMIHPFDIYLCFWWLSQLTWPRQMDLWVQSSEHFLCKQILPNGKGSICLTFKIRTTIFSSVIKINSADICQSASCMQMGSTFSSITLNPIVDELKRYLTGMKTSQCSNLEVNERSIGTSRISWLNNRYRLELALDQLFVVHFAADKRLHAICGV